MHVIPVFTCSKSLHRLLLVLDADTRREHPFALTKRVTSCDTEVAQATGIML